MKQKTAPYDFLTNGGEMGKLITLKDWSKHPLGTVDAWPQSLKSALNICLTSKFPIVIYWGKELRLFYNDAWRPLTGEGDSPALGQPAQKALKDVWQIINPSIQQVTASGESLLRTNELLPLKRHGILAESYFDYTLSPIFDTQHKIAGIFNIGQEVTERLLHDRRLNLLRRLGEKSIAVESPEAACILVANALSEAPEDVPFALIYLLNSQKNVLRLVASTSLEDDTSIARGSFDLSSPDSLLPLSKVVTTKKPQLIKLGKQYELPGGIWDEPATELIIMPLIRPHSRELYGIAICGISPRLEYNENYANYYRQIAELMAASIGSAYDLRRKLSLEAREREAQELLHTALSTGSIGIWMWDIMAGKVILDNNLALRLGIEPDEAGSGVTLGTFFNSIHPDDRAWVTSEISKALDETKVLEIECRTLARDGTIKWVIARGRVEDDENGNPFRFPGVMVDITERKEIERELARSERMFNALFESSIIGVAVMTLDGKVHEANERFLRMFGYKKYDLGKGLYTHMITPSKSKGVTSMFYQKLRKKGEVEPMETEYINKKGMIVPVVAGAVIIPGTTDRFIAFMLDISEQKQLIAINKTKDEFISIASHQLRTPATAVKQYLGMLIEGYAGKLTKSQKSMLNTAYASNERQLAIVNDLLKVAQADANELKLNFEPVNITELIQEIIDEQSGKFKAKEQTLVFRPNRGSSVVHADRLHMRMVFENILDNAHKYTPSHKSIWINISSTRSSVSVTIKDEGIGIYKKDMPKLFKKFSRIENPLSTAAGGTGLGLYWVHKIIDLHQAAITVESTYKRGSEFKIILSKDTS